MITSLLVRQLAAEIAFIYDNVESFLDTFDDLADALTGVSFDDYNVSWFSVYNFPDGSTGEEFFFVDYERYNNWCRTVKELSK